MRTHAILAAALAAAITWVVGTSAAKADTISPLNHVMEVAETSNVRAGPGTGYDVRYVLKAGAKVRVTGAVQGRDWLRIDLRGDGDEAFIYAPLLQEAHASAATMLSDSRWSVTEDRPCQVWNDGQKDHRSFTWSGACVDGKVSGEGRLVWRTRFGRYVYEGHMESGKLHGRGILKRSDGARYEGEWRDGKRHGTGSYKWAAGHRYEGTWHDDRPHGLGTATFADGDVHQGEWRQGCYGERDGIWSALIATVEDCGFN